MRINKASNISTGGILVALTLVILYLTPIIPINTLGLLTISSLFVPIALMRCNLKTAFLVYIASSLISFFIVPINLVLMYFLFFGIYGIIKFLAEKKTKNRVIEYILKLIFFNISIVIYYFIFTNFIGVLNLKFSIYIMLLGAQVAFLIYDYALTLLIAFYLQRIHNK